MVSQLTFEVTEIVAARFEIIQRKMILSCSCAGISSLCDSSFISSALDGTVQTFALPAADSGSRAVAPSPVAMETGSTGGGKGGKEVRAQGVAASEMGIFAAVAIRWVEPAGLNIVLHTVRWNL